VNAHDAVTAALPRSYGIGKRHAVACDLLANLDRAGYAVMERPSKTPSAQADPLDRKCEVCGSPRGTACTNTIRPGQPLPGRAHHHARDGDGKDTGVNDASY